MKILTNTIIKLLLLSCFFTYCKEAKVRLKEYSAIQIAEVPASFPVNFALHTVNNIQLVAYYDTTHQMVIAKRNLNEDIWQYQKLDTKIGWDSHNYISIETDKEGIIHLVGNMHSSPLIYFRSKKPFDISSMKAINKMTGKEENITTYPEFINQDGELIFHYRFGRSGSGYEIYNKWNNDSKKWERLLDKPLIDGKGKMNAYMQGPLLGPDNYYHLLWVWRNTPDCSTNHTLSYARSKDLLNWESVRGEKVDLPITINDTVLQIDTTQEKGGLLNIGIKIGFDANGNVLAGYHKYDSLGNTQLFIARLKNNKWASYQLTNWDYRWDFKGYGTIKNELLIESPKPSVDNKTIIFGYHHIKFGDGQLVIDAKTLRTIKDEPFDTPYPSELDSVRSTHNGMKVNIVFGSKFQKSDTRYMLRWETLAANRDQSLENIKIPPSKLELIEY